MITQEEHHMLNLIEEFTNGRCYNTQNPYTRECVNGALKFLANKHNISDYMDVVEVLREK